MLTGLHRKGISTFMVTNAQLPDPSPYPYPYPYP